MLATPSATLAQHQSSISLVCAGLVISQLSKFPMPTLNLLAPIIFSHFHPASDMNYCRNSHLEVNKKCMR